MSRAKAAVVGFLLLAPGRPILVRAFEQILIFGVGRVGEAERGKLKAQRVAARRQAEFGGSGNAGASEDKFCPALTWRTSVEG